ncbi:hypothetical protein TEA_009888 [Camellia sinensis var. sinensis]|uniref:Prokaryotic-type class I peptide chain release factors domain-containing protein n=1 Tax=Camellia sinensis var. sinensis TaxID=542762 RepID=A0A4S4CZC5_CAMSN|nr:hypothetical protein TEA_009888 [Camellia sinensis var. sinensis]
MSSLIQKRSSLLPQTLTLRRHFVTRLFSPSFSETQTCNSSSSNRKHPIHGSGYDFLRKHFTGSSLISVGNSKLSSGSDLGLLNSIHFRLFSSQVAVEPSTSDGLTVEGIIANQWPILEESESDWKSHASAIAQSIHLIKKRLQWKKLLFRLELLSSQLDKPDLWDDPVRAGRISREHGSLIGKMKEVKAFEQELLEHIEMIKLSREESDADLESHGYSENGAVRVPAMYRVWVHVPATAKGGPESFKALIEMRRSAKEKELEALLSGDNDIYSCFIEVQAGAGGTESMDWASMVMKMYKMWAQRRGYGVTVVDEMPGEMAGIKRATIKVDGEYAFGYAKAEVGVHRLVRISPFDSAKRRHTSFAAVAVIPILGDASAHVQINESDLRIERMRAGGAGGQHVNTTESAVRITHIPTGVTASCQNERWGVPCVWQCKLSMKHVYRSQHQNKASAMAVLQARLDQLEMARQAQMNAQHTQSLTEISWGNQIRTYVLHPYRMVKDLRTNYEVSDPDSVLEGDIDSFILSFLSAALDKDEADMSILFVTPSIGVSASDFGQAILKSVWQVRFEQVHID